MTPPVLTAPDDGEVLLYIAATTHVVSIVLVIERDEPGHVYKIQRPVYFISEVLGESKARYPQVQNLLYVWQNHLNYPGSSALVITLKVTPAQTHFKRNNSWSVG